MSELSHFEALSAKTPTKQPWAIVGGTILLIIVLYIINALAPNEAIKETKAAAAAAEAPAPVPAAAAADEDDI